MRSWVMAVVLLCALPALAAEPQRRIGVTVSGLTNSAQTLLPALPKRSIQFCVLIGGASDETVVFRAVDDSPTYATIAVAAGETKVVPVNTSITEEGLEVGTTTAAGDVTVTCVYSVTAP